MLLLKEGRSIDILNRLTNYLLNSPSLQDRHDIELVHVNLRGLFQYGFR